MFQSYALFPHLNVFNNLAFGIKENFTQKEIEINVRNIAELLSIEHLLKRRIKQLSGGEQQRVALARAFIGEPAILFADEPTGILDGESSAMVEEMLFELNKAKETTLVIVTHDRELANKAGMVLVMRDGRIVETTSA